MKARDVSVSFYRSGGQLHVWGVKFTLKDNLPTKDGKLDQATYNKKCREIEKLIASLEFPDSE